MGHPNEIMDEVIMSILAKEKEKVQSLLERVQILVTPGEINNWTQDEVAEFHYYLAFLKYYNYFYPSCGIYKYLPSDEVEETIKQVQMKNTSKTARRWYKKAEKFLASIKADDAEDATKKGEQTCTMIKR